jgi:hypothetical protein
MLFHSTPKKKRAPLSQLFHKIYKRLPPQDKVNYIIIENENICEN